jgi:hypothetical protein
MRPPFPPSVVLLELFRASKQASDLYASEDWPDMCADLSEETRAEVLKGLRATQAVVRAMIESLEDTNYGGFSAEPRSNW